MPAATTAGGMKASACRCNDDERTIRGDSLPGSRIAPGMNHCGNRMWPVVTTAISIPATTRKTMPGDVASASSPGHANRTRHPASEAWRLLKIRWESTRVSAPCGRGEYSLRSWWQDGRVARWRAGSPCDPATLQPRHPLPITLTPDDPITLVLPTRTISCRFASNAVSIGKHLSHRR
jgi:hypothetical protein